MKNTRCLYYFTTLLASVFSSVGNAELANTSNVQQLAVLLNSTFETPKSDVENIILDRRTLLTSSELEGTWFYYQLNTGENGKVYRQRFFQLIDMENGVRQKTYTPIDLARWEDAWAKPELTENLSEEDFESSFDENCDLIWTRVGASRWSGYVDPKLCKYFSKRRDATIYIESESIVDKDTLKQTERGFDANGKQLWGTKPGEYILLNRISTNNK